MKPELAEWSAAVSEYLVTPPTDPTVSQKLQRVIDADRKAREAGILVPLAVR
jgi:hypothetical protein